MHATGNLNRVGVGWVLAAVAGLALLALVWWGIPACGANKTLHFLPMVGSCKGTLDRGLSNEA